MRQNNKNNSNTVKTTRTAKEKKVSKLLQKGRKRKTFINRETISCSETLDEA